MDTWKRIITMILFVFVWMGMVKDEWKFLKIGRTMSTVTGAAALMMFQVMTGEDGFHSISLDTLALLVGCMMISAYADDAGCFDILQKALNGKDAPKFSAKFTPSERAAFDAQLEAYTTRVKASRFSPEIIFFLKMSVMTAVVSALMMNDTACVLLTPIVARAAYSRGFNPGPYLIGLATSANVGAALTPVGSPQAMIIANLSGIGFGKFVATQVFAVLLSLAINCGVCVLMCRSEFFPSRRPSDQYVRTPRDADHFLMLEAAKSAMPQAPKSTDLGENPAAAIPIGKQIEAPLPCVDTDLSPVVLAPVETESGEAFKTALGTDTVVRANNLAEESLSRIASHFDSDTPGAALVQRLASTASMDPSLAIAFATSANSATAPANLLAVDPQSLAAETNPVPAVKVVQNHPFLASRISGWRMWAVRFLLLGFPFALALYDTPGLGWVSVSIAILMVLVDGKHPASRLARVDGELLLFFSALFVVMAAVEATGYPLEAWGWLDSAINVTSFGGVALFVVFIIIGSNLISNVPLCIMLGPILATSIAFFTPPDVAHKENHVNRAWMILQFVSTIGGNLTLLGSVANLIVVQGARPFHTLGFMEYTKVGAVATTVAVVAGTYLVNLGCHLVSF